MPNQRNRRRSKRIYDLKPTRITIKKHEYQVHNISNDGVGVILEPDAPGFVIGERLENVSIPLEAGDVSLRGVVTHMSVTAAHKILGIEFLFSGKQFNTMIQFKAERAMG